jgi:chemotaxis protein MotB
LSGARAVTIVRWFVDMGSIQPKRLVAVAQAEFRPLFPNDTEEHMKKNRRSEIIVINPVEKKATMSVGAVGSIEKIPELP